MVYKKAVGSGKSIEQNQLVFCIKTSENHIQNSEGFIEEEEEEELERWKVPHPMLPPEER